MTDWPVWILAIIDVLAVHRLTRLVTADVITTRPRWSIIRWSYLRAGHDPEILDGDLDRMVEADMTEDPWNVPRPAALVVCRWCASIWIAGAAVVAHAVAPVLWLPVAALLALSTASTLLSALED